MPDTASWNEIAELVRYETRDHLGAAVQPDWVPIIKHHAWAAEKQLWLSYLWPFLKFREQYQVEASARYYNPTGDLVEPDQIRRVSLLWNSTNYPMTFGIGPDEMAVWNSDLDERTSPIERYDFARPLASDSWRIEVWPVSDITEGVLYIEANRQLKAFVADTDICTLDALLIAKFAAAALLAARDAKDAQRKQAEAEAYLSSLIGRIEPTHQMGASMLPLRTRPAGYPGRLIATR